MSRQGLMNWTQEELIAFFTTVENKQDQLFNGGTGLQNKAKVDAAWLEVGQECASLGLQRFENRSVKQLRADLYQKKKMDVLRKIEKARITGQGPPVWLPHEEIIIRLCQRYGQLENSTDSSYISDSSQSANTTITKLEDLLPPMPNVLQEKVEQQPERPNKRIRETSLAKSDFRCSNGSVNVTIPQASTNSNLPDEKASLEIEILRVDLRLKNEELKIKQQELLHKSLTNYQLLTSLKMPAKVVVDGVTQYNQFYYNDFESMNDND